MKPMLWVFIAVIVIGFGGRGDASQEYCTVAKDVARKAATAFSKNKEKGLKLFIKAHKLCGSKDMAYNLGLAFYQYGNSGEAEKYLRKAVSTSDIRPVRLNNLACVVMDNGSDPGFALKLAKKAVVRDPRFAPGFDTLARAQFAANDQTSGLKTIDKAVNAFKSARYLKDTRNHLVNVYLTRALGLIKSGNSKQGLEQLRAADFNREAALTYCQVLTRLGQYETAKERSAAYRIRFGGSDFSRIQDDVFSRQIQGFYALFKNGKENKALALAKKFSEDHPGNKAAKKAYDDLFNAFLGETGDIAIPAAEQFAVSNDSNEGVGDLLAGIGTGGSQTRADFSLKIDVETRIPAGKRKNLHAIALLMGNQRYRSMGTGMPDVKYAERDLALMARYLEKTMGYDPSNILKYTNITSGDFRTLLGTERNPRGKLHNFIRPGKSDVFIYYVGHGSPGPDGSAAYLVPVDATADYIENNGYGLDLFYRIVEQLPARRTIVVLDTCFSGDSATGSLFKNISPAMLKIATPVRQLSNTALFCAADKDQVATWYPAKRHSLFSYFFFKGLQGAADLNRDKIIRLKELQSYLSEEVRYQAARESGRIQTPLVLGDSEFVIAELK